MPVGLNKTNAGLGGNVPQFNLTGYTNLREKRLYFSQRDIALLLGKTMKGGFGEVEMGTVLALDQNTDKLVPYVPDTISATDKGRAFLANDCDQTDNFDLPMEQSYKIQVDDVLIMTDTDGSYEEVTVSDIDRDSYDWKAVVTLTGATSGTFTVAKKANVYPKAEDTGSGKRSKAVYVLDINIDTGLEPQDGALVSVLLSNAIIYQDACVGMDSTAISDLGNVSSDGQFYILK